MAENSRIEWCDHTFNPWLGCTKISDGCKNCYAETLMDKRFGQVQWGPRGTRIKTGIAYWRKPLAWNRMAELEGRRYRVFCGSLCDIFEQKDNQLEMSDWRSELWELIERTPYLDWLLLTKRPENIENMVPERWSRLLAKLPSNIWLGVTAENQEDFEPRWSIMESVAHYLHPTIVFLSLEPLLGPIDLEIALTEIDAGDEDHTWWTRPVDWVIVGGESGPNARPMHPDWARSIRDQCREALTPFFFKQWGEWGRRGENGITLDSGSHGAWLNDYPGHYEFRHGSMGTSLEHMVKVGKKRAGRLLDGREWNEFPKEVPA